jgi:diguanylate cyclase (GGDEF)-like protein/PAS domain S-box-containing protein
MLAVALSPVPAMVNMLDRQSVRLLFQSLDIRRKNMMMRNLIEKSIVGVVISRDDGQIESVNDAAASMFGYSVDELRGAAIGRLVSDFRAGDAAEAPLRRLTAEGHRECTGARADGTRFPIDVAVSEVADEEGSRFVSFISDITLRKEQEQRLQHQAEHDALTGLPNRVKLSRTLAAEIDAAGKEARRIAVYLLDLDGFKNVNDTLGHAVGDRLLQDISAKLGGLMPRGATLARFGGDEFVFFVPGVDGPSEAEAFARYVLERLKQPIRVESINLEVGGSIGAAIFPEDGGTPDELLQHSDVAMYSAKRERTGYERYWAEGDIHSVRNLTLTGDLRRAIENGELELAFQPKIDLAASTITGVEALCRWKRADLGFVPPDEFIGHAEQSGLIMPLTRWVLDKAIETGALWRECGRDLTVAVNLSAHLLHRESSYDAVVEALDRWRYPANRLTLEVTETGLLVSPERALELIGRFSALGIKVSIDDFGTGYSSLSYLATLKAHELKIDKSFVFGMLEDANSETIVRSVISMAHDLGLRVVAEGVETAEVMEALRGCGCDIGQGYLFGKPMVFADFETWYGLSDWAGGAATPAVA